MADVLPSDELVEEPSDYGALQPGTRLGRYELLVPIARGGMARVWAARLHGQRAFQKLVAIKVILPHLAEEHEFERMFLDEARIASGVHHPNVCEIYELGEEKKTLYLVMEWVSGDSFARVIRVNGKTTAVEPRVVARVVADACAGVHAAHELVDDDGRALGVVHRDLSPHNILLTIDGTAKVCDFGVAKALGQLHEATSAGQLKGKLAYMAPEQITGGAVDRRSDVFSLGCVLYEATTGQRPFRGDGDHQVMHAVLKGEVPPPTSLIRNYPQELERIVLRALAPTPILRYPTAERMRFALEELLARGQLVTQANVAQVVRARIGEQIERRKERIRQASNADERSPRDPHGNMTPSNQASDHRSGVKPSGSVLAGKPAFATLQMERPEALDQLARGRSGPPTAAPPTPPMMPQGVPRPSSSTTIPQAVPHALTGPPPPVALSGVPAPQVGSYPGAHQAGGSYPGAQQAGGSHPAASQPPGGASLVPPFASRPPAFTVPPASSVPPQVPDAEPEPPPPAGAMQYVMAIGIGVLLAAVIGGVGFYVWRGRHAEPAVEIATPRPQNTAAVASPAVKTPSPEITFKLSPTEASVAVDGQDLPASARTVPRPPMGQTVNVTIRAKGFEDVTVLVDYFTTSPMELALKPAAASGDARGAGSAVAAPLPDDPPQPAPRDPPPIAPKRVPKPPKEPKDPGVPANPY